MHTDQTSYSQSLTHMIKGNLGAGILAMPASFAHSGLVAGVIGLPILCLIATYCVHVLIKASKLIESKSKDLEVNYSNLARQSFEFGPKWIRRYAKPMSLLVDIALLITQVGVCCIYVVFLVDNVTSILASYRISIGKSTAFLAILPVTLLLSCIRTLSRLAVASLLANILQAAGLALIADYLIRDLDQIDLSKRDKFRPFSEMALGFGSAMFAFEGISVVLPIYSKMKNPKRMSSCMGVVNISFLAILLLYFAMGLLGYLKFGHNVRDSITLNLPAEPFYDFIRAMFTLSILLSYPLQFYVPNEIIWNWAKKNLFKPTKQELSVIRAIEVVMPPTGVKIPETFDGIKQPSKFTQTVLTPSHSSTRYEPNINNSTKTILGAEDKNHKVRIANSGTTKPSSASNDTQANNSNIEENDIPLRYEYYCRVILVLVTFTLAFSVPKLNLLMDLVGSLSGAALCLTIPATLHLVTFWDETKGFSKAFMIIVDLTVIIFSLVAGSFGSFTSLQSIANSFH